MFEADDAAIQADAYIDALLAGHGRLPISLSAEIDAPLTRQPGVRDAIRLLERGLPRFHPSFLFEERLAQQLRHAATAPAVPHDAEPLMARLVPIAVFPQMPATRAPDRRLLVGGAAIASGVSIASAAVFAWRRTRA